MRDYKKLKVWEKAHELVVDIYKMTKHLPKDEMYGLVSQIRRAAVSIPTNIAEGCGRDTDKDFARFLQISAGSVSELEYLIFLITELKMISNDKTQIITSDLVRIRKMLYSFIAKLRN